MYPNESESLSSNCIISGGDGMNWGILAIYSCSGEMIKIIKATLDGYGKSDSGDDDGLETELMRWRR